MCSIIISQRWNVFFLRVFEEARSAVTCHNPPGVVFKSNFHLLSPSFFRQASKMHFSPLLRPSAIVGIISRLRMQFHTTVSQSRVHSAPVGLVMWNQKPPEKATASEPKAVDQAFKSNVKHKFCGQKFNLSVRRPSVLVCSLLSFMLTYSELQVSVKCLKLNCSLRAFCSSISWPVIYSRAAHPNVNYYYALPLHLTDCYVLGGNSRLHGWRSFCSNITLMQQNNRKQRRVLSILPSSLTCYYSVSLGLQFQTIMSH